MKNIEKNAKLLSEIIGLSLLVGKVLNCFVEKVYPALHKDTQKDFWAKLAYSIFLSGITFISLLLLGIYTKTESQGFVYGLGLAGIVFYIEVTYKESYNKKLSAKNNFKLFCNTSRRITAIMYIFFALIEYFHMITEMSNSGEWTNVIIISIYLFLTAFTVCILMRFGKKTKKQFQTKPEL